jgi:hypothetical protein
LPDGIGIGVTPALGVMCCILYVVTRGFAIPVTVGIGAVDSMLATYLANLKVHNCAQLY